MCIVCVRVVECQRCIVMSRMCLQKCTPWQPQPNASEHLDAADKTNVGVVECKSRHGARLKSMRQIKIYSFQKSDCQTSASLLPKFEVKLSQKSLYHFACRNMLMPTRIMSNILTPKRVASMVETQQRLVSMAFVLRNSISTGAVMFGVNGVGDKPFGANGVDAKTCAAKSVDVKTFGVNGVDAKTFQQC